MNLQTDNMKGFKYGRLFGYVLTAMSFLSCNQVAEEGVPLSLASQTAKISKPFLNTNTCQSQGPSLTLQNRSFDYLDIFSV